MKKILIIFLLTTAILQAQQTKISAFLAKDELISFEQYDCIKKINQFYPDLFVSKSVKNCYSNNLKENLLIESYLNFSELPQDCDSYQILIYPDNTRIDYEYHLKNGTLMYGNVTIFNDDVIRTTYAIKDTSYVYCYYINSKLIYKNL